MENEALIRRAERYAAAGIPFPLDFTTKLLVAGIDATALERKLNG